MYKVLCAAGFAALVSAAPLGATVLSFDTAADCSTSEVSITGGVGSEACTAAAGPGGSSALKRSTIPNVTDSFWTASFTSLMQYVSVDLGDFGADQDELFLSLFDASNNLISTVLLAISASDETMHTLDYNAGSSLIASAKFGTTGNLGLGGVFADNLTFEGAKVAAVPLPATGFLVLAGLGALGTLKRRRKA